jgi:hypothetical protein
LLIERRRQCAELGGCPVADDRAPKDFTVMIEVAVVTVNSTRYAPASTGCVARMLVPSTASETASVIRPQ